MSPAEHGYNMLYPCSAGASRKKTANKRVYKNVSDFAGTFSAVESGIAIGAGGGAQVMENQNGVVMKLKSTKSGIKFKLAPEGVTVKMK
jgi:hypothetical protein